MCVQFCVNPVHQKLQMDLAENLYQEFAGVLRELKSAEGQRPFGIGFINLNINTMALE